MYSYLGRYKPQRPIFPIPIEDASKFHFNRETINAEEFLDEELVKKAENYLHLPVYSKGFKKCNQNPEITCGLLTTSFNFIQSYMEKVKNHKFNKTIRVTFTNETPFYQKLSIVYAGFLMAMFTDRQFVINSPDTTFIRPEILELFKLKLPKSSYIIPGNFTSICWPIPETERIVDYQPRIWAQLPYVHPLVAEKVRDVFGYHSAYFVGNFLFNLDCQIDDPPNGTVGIYHTGKWSIYKKDFLRCSSECDNEDMELIEDSDSMSSHEHLCIMKRAMYGTRIGYSFGDLTGWFAMAMQGAPGFAVERNGHHCIPLKTSQCGSLYHLYNPDKQFWFSANNDFLVCGTNYNDARLFVHNLLW